MLSIICLLIFFGVIAALMGVAFHDSCRPEPPGSIDHAVVEALLSD